ncbi:MAG: VWA domain-containing protein [Candidatus Aenigmarchaeota archaeon]|nr:VWA domain-containing protein [Candidatus Aenigmarchaeota archaeon]
MKEGYIEKILDESLLKVSGEYGTEKADAIIDKAIELSKLNGEASVSFLEQSGAIIDKLGYEGLLKTADFAASLSGNGLSKKAFEKIPGIVDYTGLYSWRPSIIDKWIDVSSTNPERAYGLMERTPFIMRSGGENTLSDVVEWAKSGEGYDNLIKIMDINIQGNSSDFRELFGNGLKLSREYGMAAFDKAAERYVELSALSTERANSFFRGETKELRKLLKEMTPFLELDDASGVLSTYLAALLGYRLPIKEGGMTCTDGKAIYLPGKMEEFMEDEKNFIVYKVLATHEEAHIEYGSFDFDISDIPGVVDGIKSKYGKPEEGKSDQEKFFSLFPEKELAKDIFNVFEDFRIEGKLKNEYPVLGRHIAETNNHFASKRPQLKDVEGDKSKAMELIIQKLISGKTNEPVPEEFREAVEYAEKLSSALSSGSSVADAATATSELCSYIDSIFKDPYKPIGLVYPELNQQKFEENVGNFTKTAKKMSKDGMTTEEAMESLKRLFKEDGTSPKDTGVPGGDEYTFIGMEGEFATETGVEAVYHEWFDSIDDYKEDWARVVEMSITDPKESYTAMMAKHAGLVKRVRKEFQSMKPDERRRQKRQNDGEEIDIDAAVEYFTDKKAKLNPSDNVYSRKDKKNRDIAVSFLIDMSGSTSSNIAKTGKEIRKTIDVEKESLAIMSEALQELGDEFSIYGFSGSGRNKVEFYTIKDFNDSFDSSVKGRIASIKHLVQNRDGAAIRHASSKLKKTDRKNKILIVLSDGEPADSDYNTNGRGDTRMALKEAQKDGIKTFCVTVRTGYTEHLSEMFTHSNWTVIDDVNLLPEKITGIYKRLTK